LDAGYLAQFLNQLSVANYAHHVSAGVELPRVDWKALSALPIAFPTSKAEQRAVVAEIERARSLGGSADSHLSGARRAIEQFRQAVLAAASSGRLTVDWRDGSGLDTWIPLPVGRLIHTLDQGWSPQCENRPAPLDNWGVIKTTAVQPGRFVEGENKRLPDSLDPRPGLELQAGDLLITRAGPRTRVGIACLVRQVRPRLLLCDKVYRLKADVSAILPEFLEIILNDPVRLIEIDDLKTGTSESGMNLTQRKIRDLVVSVPSLVEQGEIVRRVDELLQLADGLRDRVDAASRRVDRSSQAVLAKAFRGELITPVGAA
jgi:type I restriction enzyme S subunit